MTHSNLPHIYFNRRIGMWLYRHPCSLDLSPDECNKLCAFCIAMDQRTAKR